MENIVIEKLKENEVSMDFDCPYEHISLSSVGIYYIVIDYYETNRKIYHYLAKEQHARCINCEFIKNCMALTPLSWEDTFDELKQMNKKLEYY